MPSAERMRCARQRKAEGTVLVPLFLPAAAVDKLVASGRLDAEQKGDRVAVRWAAQGLLADALWGRDAQQPSGRFRFPDPESGGKGRTARRWAPPIPEPREAQK